MGIESRAVCKNRQKWTTNQQTARKIKFAHGQRQTCSHYGVPRALSQTVEHALGQVPSPKPHARREDPVHSYKPAEKVRTRPRQSRSHSEPQWFPDHPRPLASVPQPSHRGRRSTARRSTRGTRSKQQQQAANSKQQRPPPQLEAYVARPNAWRRAWGSGRQSGGGWRFAQVLAARISAALCAAPFSNARSFVPRAARPPSAGQDVGRGRGLSGWAAG